PRFEAAGAEQLRPGRLHGLRGPEDLLAALHGAGAGDHDHPASTDRHVPHPHGRIAAPVKLPADELVWLEDADDVLHPGHRLDALAQEFLRVAVADDANHDALPPLAALPAEARLFDLGDDRIQLRPGMPGPHDNNPAPASSVPKNIKPPVLSGREA